MRVFRDGTSLELDYVDGDIDELVAELEDGPDYVQYEVCERDGRQGYVYIRGRPDEHLCRLYELLGTHSLLIDLPIRFGGGSDVTVRIVGYERGLSDAYQAFPEEIRAQTTIEQVGTYIPDAPEMQTLLTPRQREVIEAAVAVGYYATPRTATAIDVAERVGCARSTASEHLRNSEARLMTAVSASSQAE
ncbi:DNA binding protein [Natrialba asiatica DSM 12278]|uniref:DNA binding protein n=1 Tax=Natrialba asiatica (strain ATCC 700177 / DSM 12278 / JCM 9576 / FERM P-10747 / NBRC 102637 / 172P1) TaxID=29540 RepID=M0ALN0_NATA1|nr:helix-turn-helix domain-containing protein [Natrialba asiatica]ELY99251.1 DNA binding protein [Natrialba asiatica DSM 12278]